MSEPIDELAAALREMSGMSVETDRNAELVKPGERPCPICGQLMQLELYNGVQIDVCPAHGMWLDNGELMSIMSRVPSGTSPAAVRRRIRDARREGKISGALLGAWSLFLDR